MQGDSGEIILQGLNTDKNYVVYFAIYDKNRQTIGNEIYVNTNQNSSIVFTIPSQLTDLLVVPKKEKFAHYYYGIKVCYPSEGTENTICLGNKQAGEPNVITVYPKQVEGTQYG